MPHSPGPSSAAPPATYTVVNPVVAFDATIIRIVLTDFPRYPLSIQACQRSSKPECQRVCDRQQLGGGGNGKLVPMPTSAWHS